MAWFSITTTIRSAKGSNVSFVLRTGDDIATVSDFADELAENGVIVGDRFRLTKGHDGGKGILDERRTVMLTLDGIAHVAPFPNPEDFELYE